MDAEGSNQLSPAVPLLISDFWEVAEEVSRYVRSGAIPCTSAKASLFKDIAHVLSPERAEGSLLVEVACRVISCAALNDMPALLEEAGSKAYGKGILQSVLRRLDDGGIGLLGLAVLSGNCRAVREALSLHRLCDQLAWAIRPCGPHGLTALHWAAFKGLSDVIALVKEEVPQAAAAWETARAAQEGCTLMELFKLYSSHQALLPEPPGNIPSGSGRVSDTGSSSYVCEHGNPPFDGGALHLLPVSAAERAMALLKAKRLKMMAPLRVCLMLPTGIGM